MATSLTSSTGNGAPTAVPINPQPPPPSGFAGDEFSNNLFSDLAPLLTLFGEQVTKQFLSMSLGWADNILFAVGPLGIITAIVSAIRVGKVGFFKNLIGRAREKWETAELELLTSTSQHTSELWTDNGVVRQPGLASTLEFVVSYTGTEAGTTTTEDSTVKDKVHISDLGEACEKGILKQVTVNHALLLKSFLQKFVPGAATPTKHGIRKMEVKLAKRLAKQPPNITLNIDGAVTTKSELWVFAVIGLALQAVALVIPAIMTYHWKVKKGTTAVQDYAYPLFLVGSCAVIAGMILCSHIIEGTTLEHDFEPSEEGKVKTIFRLQLACTLGDQEFKPFVIINGERNQRIRTSRTRPDLEENSHQADPEEGPNTPFEDTQASSSKVHSEISLKDRLYAYVQTSKLPLAVLITLSGYICQFVGLRALHWSATINQLGITLLITGFRARVRRGLSSKPRAFQLPSNPNWIALAVGSACLHRWPAVDEPLPDALVFNNCTALVPSADLRTEFALITINDPRIALRLRLISLPSDATVLRLAAGLSKAMEATAERSFGRLIHGTLYFTWTHLITSGWYPHPQTYSRLELTYPSINMREHLHSILDLWQYSVSHSIYTHRCIDTLSKEEDAEAYLNTLIKWTQGDCHIMTKEYFSVRKAFGMSVVSMLDSGSSQFWNLVLERPSPSYYWKDHCAIEIYSGFIHAVAEDLRIFLQGRRTAYNQGRILIATVRMVRDVAESLHESGLVKSIKDAYVIVVPPFLRRGLLPPEPPEDWWP